jgi:hypothetical protein
MESSLVQFGLVRGVDHVLVRQNHGPFKISEKLVYLQHKVSITCIYVCMYIYTYTYM